MEGIGMLVLFLFAITFGPPIILLTVGLVKWRAKKDSARVYLILGTLWLVIGGGTCLSMMI